MRYQLFSDLDQNFGIHFIDEETEEIIKEVLVDPVTGAKFDRNAALAYAEKITNPQDPKTKQELFERFSDEDFANYLEAVSVVKGRFASEAMSGVISASTKEYNILLAKIEIRPDFNLSEQDLKTLKNFCKEFNIVALPIL
jgi:hypothetical protein